MVKRYSNNSVFIAALCCIILFYSGIIKVRGRNIFSCIIPKNQINQLCGQLISSPAKCSDGKYYKSLLRVNSAVSLNGIKGSSKGDVTVYIPAESVEAFYPGKLYSQSNRDKAAGAFLWEAGGIYNVAGRYSNKDSSFYISRCFASDFPKTFYGRIDYFRALCRLQFKRLMYSWGLAGGLLLALLCGAKEYTSSDISLSFKNAGLSHILALSGMHLSMFSGIAMFFGKKIKRKKLSFIIRVAAIVLFVWFAGLSPSLMRAFICSLLTIIAALANVEKPDMLIILAFSFLCQTIIAPQDIYSTAFILSYTALAGILLTNAFFRSLYIKFLPSYFANSLGSSTGAQVFTAPVSLYLFGSFSPVGIIATTVVSPFVTIFIYSGLALIILSLVLPILSVPSGIFMNLLYTVVKFLVSFFAKAPVWRIN